MYKYYRDKEHGWLEVKRKELERLGILDQISGFSYQDRGMVYLEKDHDAIIFSIAKGRFREEWQYKTIYMEESPIRNYENFKNKTTEKRRKEMKQTIFASILILIMMLTGTAGATDVALNTTASVCFSPGGDCTSKIVREIMRSNSEVLVQAYAFTSKPIAEALIKAKKRGVRTEIVLDKSNRNDKYSAADFTAHMGVTTFIDEKHKIAHDKVMIIDNETVITGSFNFTKAAETSNAENIIIIRSKELAGVYKDNWEKHKNHSESYRGR